jgi:hypothetical protein
MPFRYFLGLLLVFLGVGYILQEFKIWEFQLFLNQYWPLLISLLGINQLIKRPARPFGALILIALGLLMEAGELSIISDVNMWVLLLSSMVVIIGLWFLLPKRRCCVIAGTPKDNPQSSNADVINESYNFGGARLRNSSPNFQGGRISAAFSGVEIDLRDARLSPEGANLSLDATFCGVNVWVPSDWPLVIVNNPAMGNVANNTRNPNNGGTPSFRINCTGTFCGIEIKN